jgi:TRAP transporter TAXI family solute receptor
MTLLAGCLGDEDNDVDPTSMNLVGGWGPEGSAGNALGQAVARLMDKETDISIDVRSAGSRENTDRLANGDLDICYSEAGLYARLADWKGPYAEDFDGVTPHQMLNVFDMHNCMVSRADTGIETMSDLAGHTVTVGSPDLSVYLGNTAMLEEVGVMDKITERRLTVSEIPDALNEGRIDAGFTYNVAGFAVPGWVKELTAVMDEDELRPVVPTDDEAEAMANVSGLTITETEINGIWEEPPTLPLWTNWPNVLVHPDVPQETVKIIMETIWENKDTLQEENPVLGKIMEKEISYDSLIAGDDYPVHPGAVEVYEDIGWWEGTLSEA